jgi:hypothetical protein
VKAMGMEIVREGTSSMGIQRGLRPEPAPQNVPFQFLTLVFARCGTFT